MAIRGRLEDLQAAEVLQFLTRSGRTGTLRFFDDHRSKLFSFEGGRLVFAVSQHRLPTLSEVLYQRGILEDKVTCDRRDSGRFDAEMTMALEWRRMGDGARIDSDNSETRLGRVLVRRGKISQEDLDLALEPASMPDNVLEEILIAVGGVSHAAIAGVRKITAPDVSLYEALVGAKALSREQIEAAIACMCERTLADLLAHYGYVRKTEATYFAARLDAMRGLARPIFRIGEFLIASGRVSHRQLEKALGAQLTNHLRLGEILVEQGVLTDDEILEAEKIVDELRAAFSPLRLLSEKLHCDYGFPLSAYAFAREKHLGSDKTLADVLIETGKVTDANVRQMFEQILAYEVCDLLLWRTGGYEFYEDFTLEDALAQDGLGRIHDYTFEVGALLMDAHYRIDELARSGYRYICPETILEAVDPEQVTEEQDLIPESAIRLLHRMDGMRPVDEVCSVMPGNSLSHRRLITRFVERGWVRALSRIEAYEMGQSCEAAGNFEQAVLYYVHARSAPGDVPADSILAIAAKEARVCFSKSLWRRLAFTFASGVRLAARLPVVRRLIAWVRGSEVLARMGRRIRGRWQRFRTALHLRVMKWTTTFEDFLADRGLARQWWTVKTRVLQPLERAGATRLQRAAAVTVGVVAVTLILMVPGVPGLAEDPPLNVRRGAGGVTRVSRAPDTLKSVVATLATGGPIGASPTVTPSAIYAVSRDGMLRSLSLGKLSSRTRFDWEVELGEYGDLLSQPAVFGGRVFVTNVRGSIFALSTDGKALWTRTVPRVEQIAPTIIVSDEQEPQIQGVVVVARESMHVLDPSSGETLYQMRAGNIIAAQPVVEDGRIYVGSVDNHVYCVDWRANEIVWDMEVADDVRSLAIVKDHVLALVRGGAVIALRADNGEIGWQKTFDGRPVERLEVLSPDRICVELAGGELRVCEVTKGSPVSSMPPKGGLGISGMRMAGGNLLYVSTHGYVGEFDDKGAHVWRSKEDLGDITGLTLAADLLIVTSKEGRLWFFSLAANDAKRDLVEEQEGEAK